MPKVSNEGQLAQKLQDLRYPAAAIEDAAGISGQTLTRMIMQSGLILCSESVGQGRARQFCYLDVCQIALLASFGRIVVALRRPAHELNKLAGFNRALILERADGPGAIPRNDVNFKSARDIDPEATMARRRLLCSDYSALPEVYRHRDCADPFFLYCDVSGTIWSCAKGLGGFDGGAAVNVTRTLHWVDIALASFVDRELA